MLRQVGEREAFLRAFQFDEIAVKLDAALREGLRRETQEHRRAAGVALVNEADMLRAGFDDPAGIRDGLRRHVRKDTAVRAVEPQLLVIFAQQPAVDVQC